MPGAPPGDPLDGRAFSRRLIAIAADWPYFWPHCFWQH